MALRKAVLRARDFPPRARRFLIMLMDFFTTLVAIPGALAFSYSPVLDPPIRGDLISVWIASAAFAHLLFRLNGLYDTLWRFASTQDFFNILKNCAILTLVLYASAAVYRYFVPFIGVNEREFLIFFILEFMVVSGPRLLYRYLLDGDRWKLMGGWESSGRKRRAIFLGSPQDADVVARFFRTRESRDVELVGIVSLDRTAKARVTLQGIPFLGSVDNFVSILRDFVESTTLPDVLVIGPNVENHVENFVDIVREARRRHVDVRQFRGISALPENSRLILSEVDMETLLRRATVSIKADELRSICRGQRIMITGGAGSIGSQIAIRALELGAAKVLVVDRSEASIFALTRRIAAADQERFETRVVDICRADLLRPVMREFRADVIFHAAALKHVPLLEVDWASAVEVNVMGTLNCVRLASEFGVSQFVLISSDKAAEPESVLGLTKRMAEQIVNAFHAAQTTTDGRTRFHAVRFGNVFASDGSAALIFRDQIAEGGPVTVTDRDMTRYFMILDEAVDLVLLAAAHASKRDMKTSGIYMLDMGEPIRILDMAENMIRLAGKIPYEEIGIVFTGTRPGEKIHETLVSEGETVIDIGVEGVRALTTSVMDIGYVENVLRVLELSVRRDDKKLAIATMKQSWNPSKDARNVVGFIRGGEAAS